MSRLVVVSNRVASPRQKVTAGGLAVALQSALQQSGGIWFGWSGRVDDGATYQPSVTEVDGITYATVDLSVDDYEEYYTGFANRTLWPLLHYRADLMAFNRNDFEGYLRVNAMFAQAVAPLLRSDDLVWVHDYHLITFGEELRRRGLRQPIGFFLHIPFPAPDVLLALSPHAELVRALFAYDLVGFQTERDLRAFRDYVMHEVGGQVLEDGRLSAFGRTLQVETFPIGIDTAEFARLAASPEADRQYERMTSSLHGRQLIIGVDRLDYTKGLVQRLQAFERLLQTYPESRGRVSLLQIAPPSREDVPEYAVIRRELESAAGRINGRFAEFDWVPIRYLNRSFARRSLAALFRRSRVGLVTPFRDGMNLVAKEYVAAQSESDPGVLVLSRFAGAAKQLETALIVNPHDRQGVADTIHRALKMALEERRERWQVMMKRISEEDIDAWRDRFVATLESLRRGRRGLLERVV